MSEVHNALFAACSPACSGPACFPSSSSHPLPPSPRPRTLTTRSGQSSCARPRHGLSGPRKGHVSARGLTSRGPRPSPGQTTARTVVATKRAAYYTQEQARYRICWVDVLHLPSSTGSGASWHVLARMLRSPLNPRHRRLSPLRFLLSSTNSVVAKITVGLEGASPRCPLCTSLYRSGPPALSAYLLAAAALSTLYGKLSDLIGEILISSITSSLFTYPPSRQVGSPFSTPALSSSWSASFHQSS